MSFIDRMRRQKAVYWKAQGLGADGQPSYAAPVEVDCRWEDRTEEFVDSNQEKLVSKAIVFVDRIMAEGDFLKKGELEIETENDPGNEPNSYRIRGFEILPNLKATENLLTARL